MKKVWIITVAAVAAGALAWTLWPGATEASASLRHDDPAVVAVGSALYAENCASCHGAALEGQPDWRDRDDDGYLPAPPHDETGHTWHHPDPLLFAITKFGTEAVVGGGYKSRMSGFEGVLSDDEIVAVLSYIKSTWPARVIEIHDEINAAAAP